MPDVLTAIADIVSHQAFTLPTSGPGHTSINQSGIAFETFCKDRLVGLEPGADDKREKLYKRYLIYQGANNNPPDAMYCGGDGGDAFEFKKRGGKPTGDIPLNSSWPKDRLTQRSYGITASCRECESWTERDLFYICGGVPANTTRIAWIWICDARLMAAEDKRYRAIYNTIRSGVRDIPDIQCADTKELGKVKKCDPAGYTRLRVRGMWAIDQPGKLFKDLPGVRSSTRPTLHALIRLKKWNALSSHSRSRIDALAKKDGFLKSKVEVPDPNNPRATIPAVLIRYEKVAE
jgi:hypothetical protein